MLRPLLVPISVFALVALPGVARSSEGVAVSYREDAAQIIGAALTSDEAYHKLEYLCDRIGHRLSGSPQLDEAVAWAVNAMKEDGLQNVHTEAVMVPKWVRGEEWAEVLEPAGHRLSMLGLGNSVGTPPEGITAEVVVVETFDELETLGSTGVRGKIVLYDAPYVGYGNTVPYRWSGPSRAAKLGAVATLVRSIGPAGLDLPHTGGLGYDTDEAIPRIPAAAISSEHAAMLHRMQNRGERIVARVKMDAHFEGEVPSANVVGELVGSERPEEVVILGGHLDSWDVGQGAHDDGAGCLIAWEAVRLIQELGLRPRRTLRVVLFTNEENGLAGGNAYRDEHLDELSDVVAAMESDSGNGRADGFRLDIQPLVDLQDPDISEEAKAAATAESDARRESALALALDIASLLAPIGAGRIDVGGAGADVGPMVRRGVVGLGLNHDTTEYFVVHHTAADTFDKIIPADLRHNVAAMAVMAYVLADMPGRLTEDRVLAEGE